MNDVKKIIESLRVCADENTLCNECHYCLSGYCAKELKKDAADALEQLTQEEDDRK